MNDDNKKRMVVGFAFDPSKNTVLLIRKNRPPWQAGLLNGIGGHIEDGETSAEAMAREFREECGLVTVPDDWQLLLIILGKDYQVDFYKSFLDNILMYKKMTDEIPMLLPVVRLMSVRELMVPNLWWMIPLCLDDKVNLPLAITEQPRGKWEDGEELT